MALTWTEKDQTFWQTEIKLARQKREEVAAQDGWDDNLKRYRPKTAKAAFGTPPLEINTGVDFSDVERKKAALLFEFPKITLCEREDRPVLMNGQPVMVQPNQPLMLSTLVQWEADLLNAVLGPTHANAEHAARKALFNCLCPAGVGPVTVGYEVTQQTITQQVPLTDPATGALVMKPVPALEQVGAAMGLMASPMPEPVMVDQEIPITIHERFFVSDFSPKALLIPATFRDTNFSRAPWLGKDFRQPLSQVKKVYKLPKDFTGHADDQAKPYFEVDRTAVSEDTAEDPYVTGAEIYYREAFRSDDEGVHPDALIKLVLIDGMDEPAVHEPCPHQDFDETGEMTADSLRGFPDRPLVIRDLTDSAWIPSDCAQTAMLTKEGEKYRAQIIQNRDGNKQVIAFDSEKLDPTAKDKIVNANGVIWVPVTGGALAAGKDALMTQVAQPTLGREQYMGMDVIERDRDKILGISANQVGIQSRGARTATENSIIQRNSEARFEQERRRVNAWVLDIAAAMDALILRYCDERMASQILGEGRGKVWADHKHALAGGYKYELAVDSGRYMDAEDERRQVLQEYNILRKDPFVNPKLLLKKVAEKFGHDPAEFVVDPPKPDKELKAAFSFKGEDLNPTNPAFALVVKIMRQAGWDINEQDVQIAQQQAMATSQGMLPASGVGPHPNSPQPMVMEHPGSMPKAPTVNQHLQRESGERSGPKVM